MIAVLFLEVLVITALIAVIVAWQRSAGSQADASPTRRGLTMLADSERDLAASLGVPIGAWAGIRLALLAVAIIVGVASGVVILALILVLLGTAGVPWLVEDVAASRRSRSYRALVATVRDIATGLQRMG